jgi:hypothetical protein
MPGLIHATNESHENPADHQYTVSIDDVAEELMACMCLQHSLHFVCPTFTEYDGTAFTIANLGMYHR